METKISAAIFFVFTLTVSITNAQSKRAARYLKEVQGIIMQHALYSDSIDWNAVNQKLKASSSGLRTPKSCYPLVDTLISNLRKAGDRHSGFLSRIEAKNFSRTKEVNDSIKVSIVDQRFGYIRVPSHFSISFLAGQEFANQLNSLIQQLDTSNIIDGWVVDLRGNSGGNVYPMIKGLSALLGNDVCAYILSDTSETPLSPAIGQAAYLRLSSPYRIRNANSKIAVLIDSETASSGELTAIAFQSLPQVRLFGQPSAGYTTSNKTFPLSDGSLLFLATAYMADRKKKIYLPQIEPDEFIPQQKGAYDNSKAAALRWLRN